MIRNNNEKVLIIGGSSGIGLATAELFVKNKHHITIASRNVTLFETRSKVWK